MLLSKFNNHETRRINISPTLYRLLAHSWEIIESNNNCGLGEYSESGLENDNKFLRFFRVSLARKTSQETNLQDCIDRLWLKSDPGIQYAGPKKQCSKCKKNDHHTISCPLKKCKSIKYDPGYQTCVTFYDFCISQLYS